MLQTVADLQALGSFWSPVFSDPAWHGPEGYLVGDWELTLLELGQRAACESVEQGEFPLTAPIDLLISSLGGHEHHFIPLCSVCGKEGP